MNTKYCAFIFFVVCMASNIARAGISIQELDVTSYEATIEPTIENKYLKGTVIVNFNIAADADSVVLNSGELVIGDVSGDHVSGHKKIGTDLIISLSERDSVQNQVSVKYHGSPSTGLYFDAIKGSAHTVYATSQWMVCNDDPKDKASLSLNIVAPLDKTCIASGELIGKAAGNNNKMTFSFEQTYETPSYTFGFAIGDFVTTGEDSETVRLNYLGVNYSPDQLETIFRETPSMIKFFEEKSGVKYYQSTYTQILLGNHYQEMSGYSTLKGEYGNMVLNDTTETNLISHELAHQWWGNRITCENWKHFWLNEGMATFMSAAYNEHRFGKWKYDSDMDSYHKVYRETKKRGNDKPLVFRKWWNATRDDRNLVYFKGAYVIHLLRQYVGEEKFWKAIKHYSTEYFGGSVTTADFQDAIEKSTGMELDGFFNEWVYR